MEATTLPTKVMLEHKKGTPLRFPIGTRVEVREQPESYTGRYLGMYSIGTCEGGKQWLPALVHSHEFRQDDWCPGFVCAYSVLVDGDVTPDGMQIASPVREDDDPCRVGNLQNKPAYFCILANLAKTVFLLLVAHF